METQETIPIGQLILNKLKEKKHTAIWLSKQISCERGNMYKIFNKELIDINLLSRISKVLKFINYHLCFNIIK
jgi:hypothetical protein